MLHFVDARSNLCPVLLRPAMLGQKSRRIMSRSVPPRFVRSEKLQNESSPNFSDFRPKFAPNFAPNFPQIFRGRFVLRFLGTETRRKFTTNPRHFSMQNSQANSKKKSTKKLSGERAA